MQRDLDGIEIDEMPDTMKRDAAELRPLTQRPNRWLLALRKNPAEAEAEDVSEPAFIGGS